MFVHPFVISLACLLIQKLVTDLLSAQAQACLPGWGEGNLMSQAQVKARLGSTAQSESEVLALWHSGHWSSDPVGYHLDWSVQAR